MFAILSTTNLSAKNQYGGANSTHSDSSSIKSIKSKLKAGDFSFHWRSNYMSTLNQGALMDYQALGTGAGLGYSSPTFHGFQAVFSGFFVFQLYEHNINKADPITNGVNRYEVTLFDMNNLENTKDLDRLEELLIRYCKKNFIFTLGRQKFESPFLNGQDNRMRPNIFSGFNLNYKWKNLEFLLAGFNAMTIRGTVDWYGVGSSFGVYPFGRSPFGTSSAYKGNINSRGIGIVGLKYNSSKLNAQLWNYTAENVFNMSMVQFDFQDSILGHRIKIGSQGFFQYALNKGGNPDPHKAYILPNEKTYGIGAKLAMVFGKHEISVNHLFISDRGRFLFPREWGREMFYVSLPRERFEGNGNVSAWVMKYALKNPNKNWRINLGAGSTRLLNVSDVVLNKYGMPSYYHFTGELSYKFSDYLDGLNLRLLVVNKTAKDKNIPNQFRINRVDMWHFNLVLDYLF